MGMADTPYELTHKHEYERRKAIGDTKPIVDKQTGIRTVTRIDSVRMAKDKKSIEAIIFVYDEYENNSEQKFITDMVIPGTQDIVSENMDDLLIKAVREHTRGYQRSGRPDTLPLYKEVERYQNLRMSDRIGFWQLVHRSHNEHRFKNLFDTTIHIIVFEDGNTAGSGVFVYNPISKKMMKQKDIVIGKSPRETTEATIRYMQNNPEGGLKKKKTTTITGVSSTPEKEARDIDDLRSTKPHPRTHPSAKKAAYVTAYGERHKAHKKTQAEKRAIHEQAVRETQERGLIFGHTWDQIQSMQMTGKHPPRPHPTTPTPPRKTPGATVKTDTMLRQESIKEQADMIFETFAAPRPGRVDPVGMQKTVTRNGVMATADIDTRYVRNNVVYASVEVVDDQNRRTAYKAIPIISHKAIRDALSKDMSYRGPSNAKTVYEGVLETALNNHFKKHPAPKKPTPRQHPQAKKAAYVKAYGRRHAAFEQDAAAKDIFGLTPRELEGYVDYIHDRGERLFGRDPEDQILGYVDDSDETEFRAMRVMQKRSVPARKKPAPKKAAAPRKPKAPAKKARPPAKKPASKPAGRPQVLKASTTQTGKSDKKRDADRKAMAPGKRKSATGRIYYEYRKNRSDVRGRKT